MSDAVDALFIRALDLTGGSESSLARAAGCSQNAVWAARKAKQVSAMMAIRLERATKGELPRWQWRPDLWEAPTPEQGAAA